MLALPAFLRRRYRTQVPTATGTAYHTLTIPECLDQLTTDSQEGLTSSEVQARLVQHGPNQLRGQGGVSALRVCFRQVANAMTLVLIAALVISFVVKDWIEGGVIAFIVALNVTIGFFQEYRAEKTMDSLRKMASPTSRVLRSGHLVTIATIDLVPGDILVFEVGDVVGADCRMCEVFNLEIDEALLTGESLPVAKITTPIEDPHQPLGDRINLAFASTMVTKGRGRAIVTETGMRTEIGRIAKTLSESSDGQKTPLQKGLDLMAYVLFGLACIFAVVVFAAHKFKVETDVAIYAIGLGIALIPEGLIAVVTLTMAIGVRRMAKNRALVRKLTALEALGSVTNICSDKTGTLTQSRMVLRRIWQLDDRHYTVTGHGFDPTNGQVQLMTEDNRTGIRFADEAAPRQDLALAQFDPALVQLSLCASLCNMAQIKHNPETDEWVGLGDPTETALQVFAHKVKLPQPRLTSRGSSPTQTKLEKAVPGLNGPFQLLAEFPFDSSIKRMTVVYQYTPASPDSNQAGLPANVCPDTEPALICYTKGATERVLTCCTHVAASGDDDPSGSNEKAGPQILTPTAHQTILGQVDTLARMGLRVLALASRRLSSPEGLGKLPDSPPSEWMRDQIECDLTFLGLVGIYDPPRPESWPSVQECYDAGITVHMLTGDHPATAAAIAQEVGILPSDLPLEYANRPLTIHDASPEAIAMESSRLVMTAPEFDALTDAEIDALAELPHVIARCSPDTKVKMIQALHRRKRIVAMTGDGVNDSPSLKIANVGIAMGQQGSDVAKQASHIVLTDDNFATIVRAVAEGRRIFVNIQRFVCHMVSGNCAEVIPLLIGLAFIDASGRSVFPLSPVQILVNNMLTSSPPAMSLGMEPNSPETMRRAPRPLHHGLFTWEVIMDIMVYGGSMGVISLLNFILVVWGFGDGNLGIDCNKDYSDSCDTVFRARGTLFATLTYLILFHAFNCRDLRAAIWWGWWRADASGWREQFLGNRYLAYSVLGCSLIVFPTLYIPVVNTQVFKQKPISWEWGIVVVSVLVFICISEIYKWIKRSTMKPIFSDPVVPLSRMTTTVSVEATSGEAKYLNLSGKTNRPA